MAQPRGTQSSPAPRRTPYLVFISHAAADEYVATKMREDLASVGASCFLDVLDIEAGDDFPDRIQESLSNCTELVVLLTPDSIERRWVWIEIGAAWGLGKRVVGVVQGMTVDDLLQEPNMPAVLTSRNLVALNDFKKYVKQLGTRVKKARKA